MAPSTLCLRTPTPQRPASPPPYSPPYYPSPSHSSLGARSATPSHQSASPMPDEGGSGEIVIENNHCKNNENNGAHNGGVASHFMSEVAEVRQTISPGMAATDSRKPQRYATKDTVTTSLPWQYKILAASPV